MEINIQFIKTEKNPTAENLALEKLNDLSVKYDWIIRAEVFFKEEKGTYGKGKICEIRLSCPGPRIFASSDEETFEASLAETIRDLEIQCDKRKGEMKPYS
jgi:ribosome-associated translation inhibitor RaiA